MNNEKLLQEAEALLHLIPDSEHLPRDERKLQSIFRKLAKMVSKLGQGVQPITTHSVRGMSDDEIAELALTLLDGQCRSMIDVIRSWIVYHNIEES